MTSKKPSAPATTARLRSACPYCEALERQYDDAVGHIRELLELRFGSIRQKVRELHRWQENRDEAIEEFYSHKRSHPKTRNAPRTAAA
jgi:hypothetical protein